VFLQICADLLRCISQHDSFSNESRSAVKNPSQSSGTFLKVRNTSCRTSRT
ncbi:uncharacterized, partial [Tachysurus ichikawai]